MENQQSINAWQNAEERYRTGQQVQGIVTRATSLGVFVKVEAGLEGILYAFELGSNPVIQANFQAGQEIQVYVRSIDARRKRLELSLDQDPVPGLLDERVMPPALRQKIASGAISPQLAEKPLENPFTDNTACPTCRRQVQSTWNYCVYCGGTLQRRCPACGRVQPDLPGARYCHACGRPVETPNATITHS